MTPIISASLLGGALAVDNKGSLKLMVSQPVCGGLLTGLVLGSPIEGLTAGALLQMMFLGAVSIRGERLPDLTLGGVASSALYVLLSRDVGGDPGKEGLILLWSLFVGIVISVVGSLFYRWWEGRSFGFSSLALKNVRNGRLEAATLLHMITVPLHFFYGFLILAVFLPAARVSIVPLLSRVASGSTGSLGMLYALVPFIGVGSLIRLHLVRTRVFWFGAGFLVFYIFYLIRG